MTAGLYIHVPFCVRKCRYCDFYSVPAGDSAALRAGYLDGLGRELAALPKGFCPETVYVGGGTPTALTVDEIGSLLELVRRHADLSGVGEWTCEANPGTLTREKVACLFEAGVDRVSLGVQSFSAENLAFLGRIHTPAEAVDSYRLLREAGCANVNVDLMYGIPGSSRELLRRDLERVIALQPEHVAVYGLIFEDGTPLARLRDEGGVAEVEDEEELEQYTLVRTTLARAGYGHYEISNFAKPGFACRHNVLYWSGGEYIGCGPAAHSHWGGVRHGNARDLRAYAGAWPSGRPPREFEERLEPEAKARETLVMSLRRLEGVAREAFAQRTGFDYRALRGREIDWLRDEGLVEEDGTRLRLTEKGLFVSDSVFAELV